jgi:mRNA interferase MazF
MPNRYPVGPGTVLLCDISLGGFREPEMVKRRPAVVVSPRLPYRDELCTVVPLSGTEPVRLVPYVLRIAFEAALPAPFGQTVWWAKCDMIATVGFGRLDLFRTDRDQTGRRKYLHPKLLESDLVRVRQGILNALGMGP